MGLADILRARAAFQGRTAQVECGELGILTVEALPTRELELLMRGPDGTRAVFYAACRELQTAGEELRKTGQVYTPDGILQFVSDQEAALAARTILELSGWTSENRVSPPLTTGGLGENHVSPDVGDGSEGNMISQDSDEIRPATVQIVPALEQQDRRASVQIIPALEQQDRPVSVQIIPPVEQQKAGAKQKNAGAGEKLGQDSREFFSESEEIFKIPEPDRKAQGLGILPSEAAQNVVSEQSVGTGNGFPGPEKRSVFHETESEILEALHEIESESVAPVMEGLHEIESDFAENLHEAESEFKEPMHEVKSESADSVMKCPHEIKSEFPKSLHETESESPVPMHEITSDLSKTPHEIESEFPKNLHETESESIQRFARALLEGLKRAAAAR